MRVPCNQYGRSRVCHNYQVELYLGHDKECNAAKWRGYWSYKRKHQSEDTSYCQYVTTKKSMLVDNDVMGHPKD